MPKPHGSNIKTYNYHSLSFLNAKTTASLRVCFYQIMQPKMFKVAPSKWGDFEQREILWLEKLTSNFLKFFRPEQ